MARRLGGLAAAAAVVAAATVSTVGLTQAAVAAGPAPTGRLAFSVYNNGPSNVRGEIWTVNRDGTDPVPLTTGHDDHHPIWSPTGQQMAFTRYDGARFSDPPDFVERDIDVWVMDAAGGGARQLKDNNLVLAVGPLGWSADGQQVYVVGRSFGDSFDEQPWLYALGVNGGSTRLRQLSYDQNNCPSVGGPTSPGGRSVNVCNLSVEVDGHLVSIAPAAVQNGLDSVEWVNDGQLVLTRGTSGLNRSNVLYTVPASGGVASPIDTAHRITTNLQDGLDVDGVTARPAGCTFDDAYVIGSPAMAPGGELVATPMIATHENDTRGGRCPTPVPTGVATAFGLGTVSSDGQTWKLVWSRPDRSLDDDVSVQCTPGNCLTGIIIDKLAEAPGGGTYPTTFHYTAATGAGVVTGAIQDVGDLLTDLQPIMLRVPPGQTTVTEDFADGWHLDDITCNPAATSTDLAGRNVTVDLAEGDVVECTFTSNSTSFADKDHDGITDIGDDCPSVFDPDQTDTNGDGVGDACEINTPDAPLPPRSKEKIPGRCMVARTGLNECTLKPGDIIVDRSTGGGLQYLHDFGGTWWTHAAIVTSNPKFNQGGFLNIAVMEAEPAGVELDQFQTDVAAEQEDVVAFAVVRPLVPESVRAAAAAFALSQEGKPYSPHHIPHAGSVGEGPTAYYCSGLVWRAYKEAGVDLADGHNPFRTIFPIISPDRIAKKNPGGSVERAIIQGQKHSGLIDVDGPVNVLLTNGVGQKYGTDAAGNTFTDIPNLVSDPPPVDEPHTSWAVSDLAHDWTLTLTNGPAATKAAVTVDYAGDVRGQQTDTLVLDFAPHESKTFALGDHWHQPPVAAVTASITGDRSVSLDAGATTAESSPIDKYFWDFEGDGTIDQVTASATTSHTYPTDVEAAYNPVVRVRDTAGGIGSQGTRALFAYSGVPLQTTDVLNVDIDRSTDPAPATLTVDGFGAGGVTWDFGDGSGAVDSVGATTTHDFAAGTYTVTATDKSDATRDVQAVVHAAAPTAPQAQPDEITVAPGTKEWLDVVGNDTDPDDVLNGSTVNPNISSETMSFNSPGGGLLEVVTSPNAPAGDQIGTYQVCDTASTACTSAGVTVHVDPTVNRPPSAALVVVSDGSAAPAVVGFDASASGDPDGDALSYAWDFDGDGTTDQTTTTPKVQHTYSTAIGALARVTVSDPDAASATATAAVVVPIAGTVPANPGPSVAAVTLATTSVASPVVVTLNEDGMGVSTTTVRLLTPAGAGTAGVTQAPQVCRSVGGAVVSCASGPVRTVELRPATPVAGQKYQVGLTAGLTDTGGHPADAAVDPAVVRASTIEQESSTAGTPVWTAVSAGPASGGSYWRSDRKAAYVEHTFTGSSVTWVTTKGRQFGTADVFIDGVKKSSSLDLYAASTSYQVKKSYTGLAVKAHTLKIVVHGTKNANATGTAVAVDAIRVGTATSQTPTKMWAQLSSSIASGKAYGGSDDKGYTYSFKFRGPAVTWWTLVGKNMGQAKVSIDGVFKGTYDGFASSAAAKARKFGGLTDAVHTIVITVTQTRHVGATGFLVPVDRFVVT